MNLVVIVQISSGNKAAVNGNATSRHSTGATGKLETLHHFAISGIPGEHSGSFATLTGKGHTTALTHRKSSDIISVCFGVVSNVLGSVFDFATTKELLSLGFAGLIKNDTKGSSHIDNFAIFIVVNILARVGAAVAQDVFKSESLFRLGHINWGMVVGLSDLS